MAIVETRSIRYYFTKFTTSKCLLISISTDDSFFTYLACLAEHLQRQAPRKELPDEERSSLSLFLSEEAAVNNLTLKAKEAAGAIKKPLMIFRP